MKLLASLIAVVVGVAAPLTGPVPELAAAPQAAPDIGVDAVRRVATRALERYRDTLSFVVADEHTVQRRTLDGAAGEAADTRQLRGEMFLAFLEAERRWMAIHDVLEVDGQPVQGRDTLVSLLASRTVRAVGAELAARNARYNLGQVQRNFNEPTLALAVLDPDRRGVRFSRRRVTVAGGTHVVTLAFVERERPTLVASARGGPVYAEGELDVDAASGTISRTLITLRDGPTTARLETRYARHDGLDLHVPASFTERYGHGAETIACESHYSNFRRFQASGRLAAP